MDDLKVTVAVLTYKRPEELARGLPSILAQVAQVNDDVDGHVLVDVLVVDNDPAASGEPIAKSLACAHLRYVVEPEPGISAGRNRALDEAAHRDLLVYIDDDECPREHWLSSLLLTWADGRPAAVMGRVISRYDSSASAWIEAGDFFHRRPQMPSGTEIPVAAAGNLLLDLNQVRALGVRFEHSLGLSGGEDNLFSLMLVRRGGRIVWCDESVADDHVPTARMTREWLLRRSWSHGNTASLVELYMAESALGRLQVRFRAFFRGLVRTVAGGARFMLGVVTRSDIHQARGLRVAFRGAGMISGALGLVYQEYARDDEETQPSWQA